MPDSSCSDGGSEESCFAQPSAIACNMIAQDELKPRYNLRRHLEGVHTVQKPHCRFAIPCIALALIFCLLLPVISRAAAQPQKPRDDGTAHAGADPKRVTFTTSDGVEIVADYYAPKSGETGHAPAAVLVHM